MTPSVAGPMPLSRAREPSRYMGQRSSVTTSRTAEAADRYARALKRFSPLSSRRSLIWVRTWAAVRGSMDGI